MASSVNIALLLILFILAANPAESNLISLNSSLSPTGEKRSWVSSSGRFEFGFYEQGSGFQIGVLLVSVTSAKKTVVWTANRDDPPLPPNSSVRLTGEGKLVVDYGKEHKLIANISESASSASVLDSGNFVLYSKSSVIIWSSFDFPTDTILGDQSLKRGSSLVSSVSDFNTSSGRFRLEMQGDNNLVLYPRNNEQAYWATGTNDFGVPEKHLYLNKTGELALFDSNMTRKYRLNPPSLDNESIIIIYRANLGNDGILRLFSHNISNVNGYDYNTSILQQWPKLMCDVVTFCGWNSYCTMYDVEPVCRCLPGTIPVDQDQAFAGCKRNFTDQGCKENGANYNMTSAENIRWGDTPYIVEKLDKEDCMTTCLEDCNCDAALYSSGNCEKHKLPLISARRSLAQSTEYIAYFKIGFKSNQFNLDSRPSSNATPSKREIMLILIITLGLATCSCLFLATSAYFAFKFRVLMYKRLLETGNHSGSKDELTLSSFSYSELKKATNGFKQLLGKGAFGSVYKGAFRKGEKLIAVKRLEKIVNEGEKQFLAEMLVIGRTHHKNLVRLIGYCAEDSKRLLVYEYMSNGSLADLIFSTHHFPVWNDRVRIALEVAKGIHYLHEECESPIIHCDIKPQNILMDDDWTAKISDFGLAKLLMPDQTKTFTLVRGTRGYMAPEWIKNIPISVKADVYSYGVVLLELVCCRRSLELDITKPEEIVLINWVYKCFTEGELQKLVRGRTLRKRRWRTW